MSKFTDFAEMKDAIGFKNTFQDAVAEKVSAALENFKTNLAQSIFNNNDEVNEEAKGKLPAGVVVKKVTGQTAEGESEHEVLHNGKSLGVISHDWEGNHNAVHALPGHSGEEYSHHSNHHAAVKAILKTHGIKEEVEQIDEISTNKLINYRDKAEKDRAKLNLKWDHGDATDREKDKVINRETGEGRAETKIKARTGKYSHEIGKVGRAAHALKSKMGLGEEAENVEEEKIEMTRGGRATSNAIKDIVAKNNARIAKKKADAEKAEKKKNS